MNINELSPAGMVNAAVDFKQQQVAQAVQMGVLKKALDVQAVSALSLLQAMPGPMPLATQGNLGTQVNLYT